MLTFSRSRSRSLSSIDSRTSRSVCVRSLVISLPRSTFSPSVQRQNWGSKGAQENLWAAGKPLPPATRPNPRAEQPCLEHLLPCHALALPSRGLRAARSVKPPAAPSSPSSPPPSSLRCWGGHYLLPAVRVGPAGFSACPSALRLPATYPRPATAPWSSLPDLPSQTGALFIPLSRGQLQSRSPHIPAGPRPCTHKDVTVPLVLAQQAGWRPGNPSSSGLCREGWKQAPPLPASQVTL